MCKGLHIMIMFKSLIWNRAFNTAKYIIEMLRSFHFVRCAWYQSKDHASMGPYWQNRTQEATSRSCQYCGTQGGGHPDYSCIWTQRRQTWTACGTHHVILQGTLTLIICFFFLCREGKKRIVLRSFLNSFTCIVHLPLKLFSLVERKHIFKSWQILLS